MNAANKAWYWLVAGVLALGLNGYYQDGGLRPLHELAEHTTIALADARAQFRQVATLAEVTLAERAQARYERPVPAVVAVTPEVIPAEAQAQLAQLQGRLGAMESARAQTRMARFQEMMVRRELHRAQVELQNVRLAVLTDQGRVQVALPRVEIAVPQVPAIEISPN
jgi:hypothetical protein